MPKNLVIVESPAKAKTIKKFLGTNYEVIASNGHVRDLPKSRLGIDVENDFEPQYITIRGKGEILAKLRKEVKKADKVYLATDPDREGEAISWHLSKALKLDDQQVNRITFNEITKNAIRASIKQARKINFDMVDSQQARRMIDRMVGYRISPLLWAKVKRGLSAGRVQSVALRLICDREEQIDAFVPEEYWTIEADFSVDKEKKPLTAKFYGTVDQKCTIANEEELNQILSKIKNAEFSVSQIKRGERLKKPPVPFTTSTLQQEASKQLNFSTQKTMRLAQQLYEGMEIKGHGTIGLITYLRTDSVRVSEEADKACREYIGDTFGQDYINAAVSTKNSAKKIQDAHEAIRPTYVEISPTQIKDSLSRDLFRLYQLIWKRFVASRMAEARFETTSVKIDGGGYRFTTAASRNVFDGFLSVYAAEEEKGQLKSVGKITEDSELSLAEIKPEQHFTQPPAHFTEASLVKTLEEMGIGRPSTYAPTITTIIQRRYVAKENKNLYVTEIGEVVNHIMCNEFASIVDVNFTANLEGLLDRIEDGSIPWKSVVENFYPDLDEAVTAAEQKLEKVEIADEETDVICEECGRNMVIKYGPHGRFLACPGFPDCRNTKPYLEKAGVACPECGSEIVLRKTKKGRRYYGCENNPECSFMSWQRPSVHRCPECGGAMVEKGNQLVCMDETCACHIQNPDKANDSEK